MNSISLILTSNEKDIVKSSIFNVPYDSDGGCNYIENLRKIVYRAWPERIIDALLQINKGMSWICIENLPIDEISNTPLPHESVSECKKTSISENILLACSSIAGEPYTVSAESKEIVANLIPFEETKNDYTGLGSAVELDFHIENSALNFLFPQDNLSPSALALFGLYANPSNYVATKLADARLALKSLSEEDINLLRGNNYIITIPYRWRNLMPASKLSTEAVPIIIGNLEDPRIFAAFYKGMVKATSQRSERAFQNFYKEIVKISVSEIITPGKLVLINNKYALHARGSFNPSYNSEGRADRWLQRRFITKDLSSFKRIKKLQGRVYEPSYLYA